MKINWGGRNLNATATLLSSTEEEKRKGIEWVVLLQAKAPTGQDIMVYYNCMFNGDTGLQTRIRAKHQEAWLNRLKTDFVHVHDGKAEPGFKIHVGEATKRMALPADRVVA